MARDINDIPSWLAVPEHYHPTSDRDGFIARNILAVTSALSTFRLDDGKASRFSPSTPVKLLVCVMSVLLTSLSRNYLFVLVMLAAMLVRAALLPHAALVRVARGSVAAAGLALVMTLPSLLFGQPQSALLLSTKALVCTGIVLTTSLTTAPAHLTGCLRLLHVPPALMLAVDLTLHAIVRLGQTAGEVLSALTLRSVGTNRHKGATMGGVGGVVLVKAGRAAQDTYDAMRCRGFDGTYQATRPRGMAKADPIWLLALALVIALFAYLQKAV